MAPRLSYIICTTPRSGSTLLCDMLARSGVAGRPRSLFYLPDMTDWLDELGLSLPPGLPEADQMAAILATALEQGRGGTPVFGLRQQCHSFAFLCRQLTLLFPQAADDAVRLALAFGDPLFIHLSRPDKVAQAVSWQRAEQGGLWHAAPDGTEVERTAPHRDPAYDAETLRNRLATLVAWDRAWQDWFGNQGITPLTLTYDQLSADPVATLRQVLASLGLDPGAADAVTPGLRKLADHISADWIARMRVDRG
jgi:trehalose 2-sulfotransferase